MSKELEYSKLKKKILERLNQNEVESTNEVISLYDLIEILKLHTEEYKEIYNNKVDEDIDKINLKTKLYNLFGADIKEVKSMNYGFGSYNYLLNYPFLKITFKNDKDVMLLNTESDNLELNKFYLCHKKTIDKYLDTLSRFVSEYPLLANADVNWFNKNKTITIDDGFVKCDINLNDIDSTAATLSDKDDFKASLIRKDNVERELYEYIEFYNQGLQKRTSININKLNPNIRYIVKHYYNLEKPMIHSLNNNYKK